MLLAAGVGAGVPGTLAVVPDDGVTAGDDDAGLLGDAEADVLGDTGAVGAPDPEPPGAGDDGAGAGGCVV